MTLFFFIFATIIFVVFNAESFFLFSIKSKAFSTVILASKYFKFIYLYRCNNISFCGFNFIVCTNVGSNRWNLNFQILMKLFSKVRCELNYNYKIFSSSSSFQNLMWFRWYIDSVLIISSWNLHFADSILLFVQMLGRICLWN